MAALQIEISRDLIFFKSRCITCRYLDAKIVCVAYPTLAILRSDFFQETTHRSGNLVDFEMRIPSPVVKFQVIPQQFNWAAMWPVRRSKLYPEFVVKAFHKLCNLVRMIVAKIFHDPFEVIFGEQVTVGIMECCNVVIPVLRWCVF